MPVGTVHVLHGIANSSTFISQITSSTPTPGIEQILSTGAGMPFPLFAGNIGQNPSLGFESTQMKTLLDLTGALESIVDLSGSNTDLLYKKASDHGRRVADATAEHTRLRIARAWLGIDSISAGHRSLATASCRLGTTFDGSNAPIVPAGSVALSGTPTSAAHWIGGPVVLNTVAIPGVQDFTIDFGREYFEAGGSGELYNTHCHLKSYSPVVTIRTLDHSWATYGLNGTVLTAGDFYLYHLSPTGRVANATETHIKFSATAGLITVEDTTAGASETAVTTIRVQLLGANSTTEPITCDTTAAIA
jgi:hypothetical protein